MQDKNEKTPSQSELEDLMANVDRESSYRKLSGSWLYITTGLLFIFAVYALYTAITGTMPLQLQRMILVGFVVVLAFWFYPARSKGNRTKIAIQDILLGGAFGCIAIYYVINFQDIIARSGRYTTLDITLAAIGIVLLLEACRRVVGWPIVIIAIIFIAYAFIGPWAPGFLNHRGYSFQRVVSHLFYTTEGIIGAPIGACASYIFLFILFGSFLEKTGIGQFFTDIANAIAGFSAGGPAKVAVLTSALQGTVTGSSVSNTVSTGSFTIPLMKSLGYKPEFAAAVEASASTGGQIMPPIMGAAAFFIAEAVGISYIEVAKAAVIPALLYFTGIWIMIHLEAKKLGLKGIARENLPKAWPILKERGHLMIPLIVIIGLLVIGFSPIYSALGGIGSAIIVPFLRKSTRIHPKALLEALTNGSRNIISVACACGVAGIIVGIVTLTGLGLKLGEGLIGIAGDMMLLTLFFTMITSLVLGMGVPTTANYLITSTIAAPIIMRLGVPALAAHMFTFYFGILADITPPVALAAYAGSAIAKSNPFKTGVTATKLAISGFIIPYIFVLNPALILIDTNPLQVVQIVVTSLIGIFGVSAGMTGWVYGKAVWWERILLVIGGIMLIAPDLTTDIIGISIVTLLTIFQRTRYRKPDAPVAV